MRELSWRWLGRRPYGEVLEAQRATRAAIIAGEAPEQLWALEHEAVVTVGRRPAPGTPTAEELARHGFALHQAERGGLATVHEPGQLVVYVLVDAWSRKLGVRGLVCALEAGVMTWLREQGVEGHRREGHPGVWVGRDKICAVGLHFSQGISMHGLALNLDNDLKGFGLIVPCGISDGGVTSLAHQVGAPPSPEEAAPALVAALSRAMGLEVPPCLDASDPGG